MSTTSRRICLIVNPAAGRGRARRMLDEVRSQLPADTVVRLTERPGDAAQIASHAIAEGHDVIAVMGGDGTLNEVLPALLGSETALAVLPGGTGNDFVRALRMPRTLAAALANLRSGVARPVDVGTVNGRPFLNIAGCGFDAAVAARINQGGRLQGTPAYVAAVVTELFRYEARSVVIEIDGQVFEERTMLCSVCNTPSYGGGMRIAPTARIDSGVLEVAIVRECGRAEFLRAFPRVFRGTHLDHPKFWLRTGRTVRIRAASPLPLLVDGEVDVAAEAVFTVSPGLLRVLDSAE